MPNGIVPNKSTTFESLPVSLTDEEVRLKGAALAELVGKKSALQATKRHTTKTLSDEIKEIEEKADELSFEVRQRKEYRQVECREFLHIQEKIARLRRLDTMEVVRTRPLNPGEMQREMFDEGDADGVDVGDDVDVGDETEATEH